MNASSMSDQQWAEWHEQEEGNRRDALATAPTAENHAARRPAPAADAGADGLLSKKVEVQRCERLAPDDDNGSVLTHIFTAVVARVEGDEVFFVPGTVEAGYWDQDAPYAHDDPAPASVSLSPERLPSGVNGAPVYLLTWIREQS